ncbi:MAG: penicillin-binding protein 2 [Actinobacteria bacterium]|nr:penicillin-binding protein 2 [Actinomycetota bacterium]
MNARIRRIGFALLSLFLVLAGQLTYLQIVEADDLARKDPARAILKTYAEARGPILTAEGEVVARSVPTGDEFRFRRLYPLHSLFGHVSGRFSLSGEPTGVEAVYNSALAGTREDLRYRSLGDLLIGKEHTGTVVLSIRADAQRAARDALAGRRGSVVALDPKTGEVLALYSEPSYDPEPLSDHDAGAARRAFDTFNSDPANPMLPRAWREVYAPGSTFKIVTAASAIEQGVADPERDFPVLTELELPLTDRVLRNFGGSRCGGTLAESFRRSCNTTFGQLGLDLGEKLITTLDAFGIGEDVPLDLLPAPVASLGPEPGTFKAEQPTFAFAGIGQGDVAVTPLQMALVTSAIANDGVIMAPHVVQEIRDVDGVVVDRMGPEAWRRAVSSATAATVRDLMVSVVASGTGTRAQISGVTVAGKTGTAQAPGGPPHTWFVAFAPAEDPQVAIAVLVERGGDPAAGAGDDATGGRVAAPVAKAVMEVLLKPPTPAAGAEGASGGSGDDG